MGKITLELKDDLQRRLDEACRRTGRNREEYIEEMLKRSLTLEAIERLRVKFVPRAEKLGFHDDQDIFDAVS